MAAEEPELCYDDMDTAHNQVSLHPGDPVRKQRRRVWSRSFQEDAGSLAVFPFKAFRWQKSKLHNMLWSVRAAPILQHRVWFLEAVSALANPITCPSFSWEDLQ